MALLQINAARTQFVDANGAPLTGGTVTTYIPSTTTPVTTYQDPVASIENTNPITLDSLGSAAIWYTGLVRMIVMDALGNQVYDQIGGQIGGLFFDGTLSVPTRTKMKQISPLLFKSVVLTESGRQGTFVAIAGSPPRTDTQEGVYVVSSVPGWYWSRIYAPSAYPSVTVFGALGGTNNDTVAVQASIDVLDGVDLSLTGSITGWTFGGIVLANNQKMTANTKARVTSTAQVGGYVVRVRAFGIGTYAVIENLQFDLSAADDASTAIRFGTGTASVFGARIRGCDFLNCPEAIGQETHATNWVVDVFVDDCYCYFTRGTQVNLKRSRGFITLRNVKVDYTFNSTPVTYKGISLTDFIGAEIYETDVVGPTSGAYQAGAFGLYMVGVAGSATVWLRRMEVDNTRGPAIYLDNFINLKMTDCVVYQNLGSALDIRNVTDMKLENVQVYGGVGLTGAAALAHGISLTNVANGTMTGCSSNLNTGDGLIEVSCTNIVTFGGTFNNNTGYGIRELTSATRNGRSGVYCLGNGLGSLTQIGAQSATTAWWPNSGTFTASTVGAATVA